MKLTTKAIATLLIAATTETSGGGGGVSVVTMRRKSQFDYLLRRHDRKGELRAELLNIAPMTFRAMQKRMSFEDIVRRCGFTNVRAFRVALFGKLKNELHHRGWSMRQIDRYITLRRNRLA